jgi:tetratricopeptide (TPR) repeat protein
LKGFHLFAALFLFALGLASKPMLVTLPFVLLLLDFWPLNRVDPKHWLSRSNLQLLVEKIPFFVLSAASCVITYIMQQRGGAVSTSLSLGARVANALVSYVRYMGKFFWPHNLSVLYPHPGQWPLSLVLLSSLLLVGIFVVVLLLARPKPYLAVGWLWFFGTLVPVIGLVQVGIQSMADRYMYVPMIGLLIPVVWGSFDLFASRSYGARMLWTGNAVALVACGILTMRQTQYWRDSEALFRHAVQVTRKNYLAYNNLGFYLSNHGKVSEAMENYRKSLEINPNYEDALNNMGYALAGQKHYAEALPLYEAALRVRPRQVEVHNNLGNALSELGRLDEAIQHYQFVLEQKPDHADANNNLGIALAMKGRLDEAIPLFRNAIRFKPDYASAHSNLGNALAVQHKIEDAIQEYREALRLKPDEPQVHNNLGNALAEQGKLDEAIEYYNGALKLNADNPEAHFNLGIALARKGKPDEAAQHFAAALKLKPDYAEARRALESMGRKADSP